MVLSSMVAAWADIRAALSGETNSADVATLTAGYFWMGINVLCTATYVLGMRKTIHKLQFKDWDTMFYNNLLTIPVVVVLLGFATFSFTHPLEVVIMSGLIFFPLLTP